MSRKQIHSSSWLNTTKVSKTATFDFQCVDLSKWIICWDRKSFMTIDCIFKCMVMLFIHLSQYNNGIWLQLNLSCCYYLPAVNNKHLINDWSQEKQWILFPENLNDSMRIPRRSRGKHQDSRETKFTVFPGIKVIFGKKKKTNLQSTRG